jgi:hypothetical protein
MTAEEIEKYLGELNDELCAADVKGEVCLYGGAVMCLAFKARPATKDVDAIFEPVREIRRASMKVAEKNGLAIDWLNFAVKMFVVEHQKEILFDLPCLKVFIPLSDYLLAMKVLSARADTPDLGDIKFLIDKLGIGSIEEVLDIVKSYYPRKEIKPSAIFALEEIFGK